MKSKSLCSVAALFLIAGLARAEVTLVFSKPAKYSVSLSVDGRDKIVIPVEKDAGSVALSETLRTQKGKWTAAIEDTSTGNEALILLPKAGVVTIKPADFDRIDYVHLVVTSAGGGAPDSCVVSLTDGKHKVQSAVLRADDKGHTVFRHVAGGEGMVDVQQGAPSNHQSVSVRIPLKRSAPGLGGFWDLPVVVTLPDGMKTVTASAPTAPTGSKPAPVHGGSGALTGLLGFLIALGVLAAAGLYGVKMARAKGITAQSALAAVGVQMPDDPEPVPLLEAEPPRPQDPTVCPFCGGRKDPNAPCAKCAVSSGPQPAGALAAMGPPRLVWISGPAATSVIPLSGAMTIGRDPSRDIPIPDDAVLSRHHATFETAGSTVTLVDNASSNGTWVNGRKVDRQMLRPGDEIALGSSHFRFEA
jgi:hypothetical protein